MGREKRSQRRAFVRGNHPDVGGDPDRFREGLEGFEEPLAERPVEQPATRPAAPPVTDRVARGLGRIVARAAATPREVKDAYREGRHTDDPL